MLGQAASGAERPITVGNNHKGKETLHERKNTTANDDNLLTFDKSMV